MLKNKKADERTATQSSANKNLSDSFTLWDKIKVLYRFILMPDVLKKSVYVSINSLWKFVEIECNIDRN